MKPWDMTKFKPHELQGLLEEIRQRNMHAQRK